MIIAGVRPPDPADFARELRTRVARTGVVGEPRSGEVSTAERQPDDTEPTPDPPAQDEETAN